MIKDTYDIDLANEEIESLNDVAIRLSNALRDINNLYGEIPAIKKIINSVDEDVRLFAGGRLSGNE